MSCWQYSLGIGRYATLNVSIYNTIITTMSLLDRLTSVFSPYDCLNCGREGALLCDDCGARLKTPAGCCFRCGQLTDGSLTCDSCQQTTALLRVQAATYYSDVAKSLIWQLKFQGAQAVAPLLAKRMAERLAIAQEPAIITHIPTATSRVRSRGYDQAGLVARAFAREVYLPHLSLLARVGQQHQVGADRRQRLTQLAGAFRVTQPNLVRGQHIIIVDDVLTTGATLMAATQVLNAAGARRVESAVFARAERLEAAAHNAIITPVIH